MKASDGWMIYFFLVSSLSLLVTLIVLIHMFLHINISELKQWLLFLLFLTSLIHCFTAFPIIWTDNGDFCAIMGWLRHFMGFSHVNTIVLLSCHYYSFINLQKYSEWIEKVTNRYGNLIIFIVPCILTVLPFSTNSYGESAGLWCTFISPTENPDSQIWDLVTYFCPVFALLLFTCFQMAYAFYLLNKTQSLELNWSLFWNIGIYILITILSYIPRFTLHLISVIGDTPFKGHSNEVAVITYSPFEIAGILYAMVYLYNWYYYYPKSELLISTDGSPRPLNKLFSDRMINLSMELLDQLIQNDGKSESDLERRNTNISESTFDTDHVHSLSSAVNPVSQRNSTTTLITEDNRNPLHANLE